MTTQNEFKPILGDVTVAQFIEWLKTRDQEAIVQIVYEGDIRDLDLSEEISDYFRYTDFRGNKWVKEHEPYFNKRYLLLGREI
jgi:hypothetical protein